MSPVRSDPESLAGLLHPSEEVHRVVLACISDAVFITDDAGAFTYICPNVATIFGYTFDEVVRMRTISALMGEGMPTPDMARASGEVANLERVVRDKRGAEHTLLVNVKHVEVERGTTLYTCRDITERKRVEEALAGRNANLFAEVQKGRDKLRDLARRDVTAQERERARLSRELHDESGQYLTALLIHAKMARDALPPGAERCEEQLAEVIRITESVTDRLRRVAQGLRPPALDTLGIRATLAGLCREVARQYDIAIDYEDERVPGLGEDAMITLYRFLQEALTNVVRHADATSATVRFFRQGDDAFLAVEDDGKGFDPGKALGAGGGLGLAGMRERLEFVAGAMEVVSRPGCGTRISARVPSGK